MNDIRRVPTEQWENVLGVRLLPPVLRYNPERDRPALPSHTASWTDVCTTTEEHRQVSLALTTGWPDRWLITHRHGSAETTDLARDVNPNDLVTADPIRNGTWHRNTTARAGLHFMTSVQRLIYHDSLFERDLLWPLDFDGTVNEIASQPFTMTWTEGSATFKHTPDFAVVLNGEVWIINVRPAPRMTLNLLRNAAALHALCRLHGWREALVTDYQRPPLTVLSTIAAARSTADPYGFTSDLLDTLDAGPSDFGSLVEATRVPALARAVLQRMIWDRDVTVDLNRVLTDDTVVSLPEWSA